MENEFKGTKGKYFISDGIATKTGFKTTIKVKNSITQTLCVVKAKSYEESKANAQLISKAPEMLEMLIDITTHPNSISNDCGEGVIIDFEDFNKIIQLIKEATTI